MSVETQLPTQLPQEFVDVLFADAHTAHAFEDREVPGELIDAIYESIKWAPTSMNNQPLRITWVKSQQAREQLVDALMDGNKDKTAGAPLTAILSADNRWYKHFGTFAPWAADREAFFASNEQAAQRMARDNAFIQAGYFITAVRALGLAAGPMGGFDSEKLDGYFNADNGHTAILVVNVGFPTATGYRPRGERLSAEVAVRTV